MSVEGIRRVLGAQSGIGTSRQLLAAGFSRRTTDLMVRRGDLVRVRRDVVVLAEALVDLTPWERQTLLARAVGRSLALSAEGEHALSHQSALMIHDLPYFGEDGLTHLVRTDGRRGRRDNTIWVHRPVDPRWVVDVNGIRVIAPVLAALQVAALCGVEAGLVALDGVLHEAQRRDLDHEGRREGPATAEVRREMADAAKVVGESKVAVTQAVQMADGRSESAGESRSRWLIHVLGFGPSTPQFEVRDGPRLVGVADLKLDRWRVIIEFDGTGKYGSQEDLIAEKDREDRIRALGYEVVRLRWADLGRPQRVRQLLLAAIARAEARATPTG